MLGAWMVISAAAAPQAALRRMARIEMLHRRRAYDGVRSHPWQKGGLAAPADPTGCFLPSCRALSSKGHQRPKSGSFTWAPLATRHGFTGGMGSGATVVRHSSSGGRFIALHAQSATWITPDGPARPHCEGGFPSEAGRYHLYISNGLPLGHRTAIFRSIKARPDALALGGALVRWQTRGWGHFAAGDGVIAESNFSTPRFARDLTPARSRLQLVASRCHCLCG